MELISGFDVSAHNLVAFRSIIVRWLNTTKTVEERKEYIKALANDVDVKLMYRSPDTPNKYHRKEFNPVPRDIALPLAVIRYYVADTPKMDYKRGILSSRLRYEVKMGRVLKVGKRMYIFPTGSLAPEGI